LSRRNTVSYRTQRRAVVACRARHGGRAFFGSTDPVPADSRTAGRQPGRGPVPLEPAGFRAV